MALTYRKSYTVCMCVRRTCVSVWYVRVSVCSRGDAFMVSFSIVIRIPGYGRVNLLLNPICECSCDDDAVSLVLNWPASDLLTVDDLIMCRPKNNYF